MFLRGYKSVSEELIGDAVDSIVDTNEIERDTILFQVIDKGKCTGCGRCYISCRDGGHQAIIFDSETRKPKLNGYQFIDHFG